MGRDYFYKPGSFYRICDRTGFRVRAERTRMEWDNLIVRDRSWEIRQPQDFVRGVRDDQNVPDARPRPVTQFIGPAQTTIATTATGLGDFNSDFNRDFFTTGQAFLIVNLPFTVFVGNTLGIMLNADMGTVFMTRVQSIPRPGYLVLDPPLPGPATAGNLVTNFSSPEIQPGQYGASNGN